MYQFSKFTLGKVRSLLPSFLLGVLVSALFFYASQPTSITSASPNRAPSSSPWFFDDFNDGNADGWELIGTGTWSVVNNEFVIEMGEGIELQGMAMAGDPAWDNFVYEVDIRGEAGVDKMLMARYVDAENWYALNLRSAPFNDLTLSREEAGNHTILASVPFENEVGVWYHLIWGFDQRQIQVYMDETLLIDYEDCGSELTNGRIGLLGHTGSWGVDRVAYNNVLVRQYPDLRDLLYSSQHFLPYIVK